MDLTNKTTHIYKMTKNEIILHIKNVITHCSQIVNNFINMKLDNINFNFLMSKLIEHMYLINFNYSMCGFMELINNSNEWVLAEKELHKYIQLFYTNKDLHNKITNLHKLITNEEEQMFLEQIIKKFILASEENIILKNKIQTLNDSIYKIFETNKKIKPKGFSYQCVLSTHTYNSIQFTTPDNIQRAKTEDILHNMIEPSIELLADILIYRNDYAKLNNCDTYFKMICGVNYDDIKILINNLASKADALTFKELEKIKILMIKDNCSEHKINITDIIYYHNKTKTNLKFTPKKVINVILNTLKYYFGLDFKKMDKQTLWDENVITYHVFNSSKVLLGILYMDLFSRPKKIVKIPICVSLTHNYVDKIYKTTNPAQVVLIFNYLDVLSPQLDINDIILLFKEFGHVIKYICRNSTTGSFLADDEMSTIIPQIFEYIGWDEYVLGLLCDKNKINMQSLIDVRNFDFGIQTKLKCVNALFDHILHNTPNLPQLLKSNNKTKILTDIYTKVYSNVMGSCKHYLNINVKGINPNVIIQAINGSETIVYGRLLSEILAYSVFKVIKKTTGIDFMKQVISNNTVPIKTLIYEFISELPTDSYELYLKDFFSSQIQINELDLPRTKTLSDQPNDWSDANVERIE